MRKMKTKKEIEFAYDYSIEQMYIYDDLACKEECESIKNYYREQRKEFAIKACTYGWVLGKEGY